MIKKDVKLLGSLIDYVKDIKPYHSKLREFASELLFEDKCNLNIIDDMNLDLYFQNIWTRNDPGGFSLSKIAEGIESDRT